MKRWQIITLILFSIAELIIISLIVWLCTINLGFIMISLMLLFVVEAEVLIIKKDHIKEIRKRNIEKLKKKQEEKLQKRKERLQKRNLLLNNARQKKLLKLTRGRAIKTVQVLGTRTGMETGILATYNFTVYSLMVIYTNGQREVMECQSQSENFQLLLPYIENK